MRKTFANTIRKDITVIRKSRGVEVRSGKLSYRSSRANSQTAEYLNSKIPAATIVPPIQ